MSRRSSAGSRSSSSSAPMALSRCASLRRRRASPWRGSWARPSLRPTAASSRRATPACGCGFVAMRLARRRCETAPSRRRRLDDHARRQRSALAEATPRAQDQPARPRHRARLADVRDRPRPLLPAPVAPRSLSAAHCRVPTPDHSLAGLARERPGVAPRARRPAGCCRFQEEASRERGLALTSRRLSAGVFALPPSHAATCVGRNFADAPGVARETRVRAVALDAVLRNRRGGDEHPEKDAASQPGASVGDVRHPCAPTVEPPRRGQ